ncbi:helix-turn-helix domain-containing protein [Aquirufa sp. ROCK2-A2]
MRLYSIDKTFNDVLLETAGKVKSLRKQSHFTQKEFAERSGVSLGSLKRFENTGQISFESLLKLVNVLHRLEDFDNILNMNQDLKRLEKMFSK